MRKLETKSFLNSEERFFLHLSSYKEQKKKFDLPLAVTREGISEAIGIGLTQLSRQITNFKKKDYIKIIKGRAKGKSKNQDFYFLNSKGKKQAQNLIRNLKKTKIEIIGLSDSPMKVNFFSVLNYLNEADVPDITQLDIGRFTSHEGILDVNLLKKEKRKKYVDATLGVPKITHFFGRVEEINKLRTWIGEKGEHNIIFIHGMAGIGKTTIAAKLIEDYRNSKHLFWYEFHQMDTLRGVLFKLADFLTEFGNDHLEMFLRTRSSYDINEISKIIGKSIRKMNAILVFDDFQKSNDQIRTFFVYFLGILSPKSQTKMMILSREIVPFYDSRDVLTKKTVGELGLEGLDFESSKKMLKEKGIKKVNFKDIYGFTAGNPLFLEVFQSEGHLDRFVHDELFLKLMEKERKILSCLSIYRYPVFQEALAIHEDMDFETLFILTQKSLVKLDIRNRYFIHDILRKFFYARLSRSKRKDLHLLSAKWYIAKNDPVNLIEAVYHYQEAGETKSASELITKNSKTILEGGFASELLTILDRFDEKDLESNIYTELLFIKGKASYMIGEWKKALQYYTECSDLAAIVQDNELRVKTVCQSGYILEEYNELEKALDTFKNSLSISKNINYRFGIAESYRGVGRIHWRTSQIDKAISNYKKSLEISNKEGFDNLSGSTYIDLGNAYDEKCERRKAIDSYNKSIDLLLKSKNIKETARAYGNMGVTYRHFEDYKKAIKFHKKQLDLLKGSSHMMFIGYGYSWIGYCYAKIKDFKNAKRCAKRAEDIARKIENKNIMFDVNKTKAFICLNENKWDEAIKYFNKSIKETKKINELFPLAETHFELGQMYQEAGLEKSAKENFNLARKYYRKLGLENNEFVKAKLDSIDS